MQNNQPNTSKIMYNKTRQFHQIHQIKISKLNHITKAKPHNPNQTLCNKTYAKATKTFKQSIITSTLNLQLHQTRNTTNQTNQQQNLTNNVIISTPNHL